MFDQKELQFILDAVNADVKRNGLNSAAMGLQIAGKIQEMAAKLDAPKPGKPAKAK